MTTEYVLILALYAFILLGAFLGKNGPITTFNNSAPRLAAVIERDISVGQGNSAGGFNRADTGNSIIFWADPKGAK